jgi:hypothetical protein
MDPQAVVVHGHDVVGESLLPRERVLFGLVIQLNGFSAFRVFIRQNYGHRWGLPPNSVHVSFLLMLCGVFVA